MKLRIENNSIRFRISPDELARLDEESGLEAATQIFGRDGASVEGEFIYALAVDRTGGSTRCRIEPGYIMFILDPESLDTLRDAGGYVFHRDVAAPEGGRKRFLAYVEIDRPVTRRNRPEVWLDGSG